MADARPLVVPVAFEGGCWLLSCLGGRCLWLIPFLRVFSALEVQQRIHGGPAALKHTPQFAPAPISGTDNFTEGNGLAGEFSTYSAAQELVVVEDTDLCHVPC
ncbi:MAG TPA: hypothetical protein VF135_01655, partial [Terriglobales bacterium]